MEETQMIVGSPLASTTKDSSDLTVPPDEVLKHINHYGHPSQKTSN